MCASGIDFTGKSAVMYMCARESNLKEIQRSYICVLGNRFCKKVSSHIYVSYGIDLSGKSAVMYMCASGIDFKGKSAAMYMSAKESILQESL
jgi:hypothetical protein